jgi:hypothetical protein
MNHSFFMCIGSQHGGEIVFALMPDATKTRVIGPARLLALCPEPGIVSGF